MDNHSPGPWAIDSDLPPNGRSVIARVDGIPISANIEGPHDEGQSMPNAKLISASPIMLGALRMADHFLTNGECSSVYDRGEVLEAIRNAIEMAIIPRSGPGPGEF